MDKKEVLRRSQYAHDDEYDNEIKHKGRTFGMYFNDVFLIGTSILLTFSGNDPFLHIFGGSIYLSDLLILPFFLNELCYQIYAYYFKKKSVICYLFANCHDTSIRNYLGGHNI